MLKQERFESLLMDGEALVLVALALKGAGYCSTDIVADSLYDVVLDAAVASFVTDGRYSQENRAPMTLAVRGALSVGGFYSNPSCLTMQEDCTLYEEDIAAVMLFMEWGRQMNPKAFVGAEPVLEDFLQEREAEAEGAKGKA